MIHYRHSVCNYDFIAKQWKQKWSTFQMMEKGKIVSRWHNSAPCNLYQMKYFTKCIKRHCCSFWISFIKIYNRILGIFIRSIGYMNLEVKNEKTKCMELVVPLFQVIVSVCKITALYCQLMWINERKKQFDSKRTFVASF